MQPKKNLGGHGPPGHMIPPPIHIMTYYSYFVEQLKFNYFAILAFFSTHTMQNMPVHC